ncbi:hypothetical protein CYLTODRAFT_419594 [Cylindrobasidium torrendii FP15055 ss-10]|uniref:Uncharacterized protein n=1 Tax=Cylindrobasidium torrendii FP15055 ss-10 TaxID=1314674 RepID=A0A0D7BK80_9AGAR|nr:hypothetical protein CYLTODRAFT_419594 [Cylindrobasidium torrendii FP15055 ss-10]
MADPSRRASLSAVKPNQTPGSTEQQQYSTADLYSVNSLSSFSFGNASSTIPRSTTPPIGPHDVDSDDHAGSQFDVTPRPSVFNHAAGLPSPYHTQQSLQDLPGPSHQEQSLEANSRRGYHSLSPSTSLSSLPASEGVVFDDELYYSDDDNIEISSARFTGSVDAHSVRYDGSTTDFQRASAASFASGHGERRVSLPIAVPDPTGGRERENSILTLRRPSKSLENEGIIANSLPSPSPSATFDSEASSVPSTDNDWKGIRARQDKGKQKAQDPPLMTAPPITIPPLSASSHMQDFDLDWNQLGRGITSFEQPSYTAGEPSNESRRGSTNSLFPWLRRGSTSTASVFSNDDPFFRAVGNLWAPDYRKQQRMWTFARERSDGPGSPTAHSIKKSRGSLGDSSRFGITSITSGAQRERDKEAWRSPLNWRGMPTGSQEVWTNELVGRFKVDRRAAPMVRPGGDNLGYGNETKRRLIVEHFRDGFTRTTARSNDPSMLVHKHSRTIAFSISRFYRHSTKSSHVHKEHNNVAANMVLLAPKKVQEAYTSTTSTRRLESHGLLEDKRPPSRGQPIIRKRPSFDPTASTGSTSSSAASSQQSSRPSSMSASSRRERPVDWDSDDDEPPPPKTPYSEAYGAVESSQLDQYRATNMVGIDDSSSFLARIFRSNKRSEFAVTKHVVYEPAWLTLEPRNKAEQTQRVVDNLNQSFQEVGLLQTGRPRAGKEKDKSKDQKKEVKGSGIFQEIPDDVLYMLLPLWPSDTDPLTASQEMGYVRPVVDRQYLLVCYKTSEVTSPRGSKRTSPTSSWELKDRDGRDLLLPAFNVTGRVLSHRDIQGSGMRVSEGIAVNGPLSEAYSQMPPVRREDETTTVMIAICRNREAGVEFLPEGLLELGLCRALNAYPPGTIAEEAEAMGKPAPVIELTPIGRAVIAMAWVGGLAVTSFGPST